MISPSKYNGHTADEIIQMSPIVVADSVGVSIGYPYAEFVNTKYTWDQLRELQKMVSKG